MSRLRKSLAVGISAVVLSTLGIQASDLVQGINSNVSGIVLESTGLCDEGSTELLLGNRAICVDVYEASPGVQCPRQTIDSVRDTQDNINMTNCKLQSVKNAEPWNYVSFTQAQQLCARNKKRLPTSEEWYKAVSGFSDVTACTIDIKSTSPVRTGSAEACVSPAGVYDLVGNVWEWVDNEVVDGFYNDRSLPKSGYIASVDRNGVVIETSLEADEAFGKDYAWTNATGVYVMIRGGFYGSGSDAGLFTQNLSIAPNFQAVGVGFRCVQDV